MSEAYPPFHTTGDPDGDFYALALAEGMYVAPSGSMREEAFLVLYFSPAPDFTRLSFHTCARHGRLIAYSRGNDRHDTPEFALLKAWYSYGLPAHAWRLYPAEQAQQYWAKGARDHEDAYAAMRRSFASIMYHVRLLAAAEQNPNVPPLFQPSGTFEVADPFAATLENEELFSAAADSEE